MSRQLNSKFLDKKQVYRRQLSLLAQQRKAPKKAMATLQHEKVFPSQRFKVCRGAMNERKQRTPVASKGICPAQGFLTHDKL
jgi:hypothetical protein